MNTTKTNANKVFYNPKLAVIIPAYNRENYVSQAIMSVLKQPVKDVVVIAIDDGSKDNTLSELKSLQQKDTRLKVIHQDNQGVSVARNRGIQEAYRLGVRYIAFLDSDDVWCRDIFNQEVIDVLNLNQYDLIGFGRYNGNSSLTRGYYLAPPKKISKYGNSFCICFYSTDLLKKNSIYFCEKCTANEDTTFYFLCSYYATSYHYIQRPLFVYRSNDDSLTHAPKNLDSWYFKNIISVWDWVGEKLEKDEQAYNECETMKKTMLTEYIVEACQAGYSIKHIKTQISLSKLNYYTEGDNVWVDDVSKKNYEFFEFHPILFWIRERTKGIFFRVARSIKNWSIIQKIRYSESLEGLLYSNL